MHQSQKDKLLIVGAFPPRDKRIFGGVVTDCRLLMKSSLPSRYAINLLDTTQASNPPPGFIVRLMRATRRLAKYVCMLLWQRPECVLIFTSSGAGLLEKGLMARIASMLGIPVLLAPRGGGVLQSFDQSIVTRFIARFAYRTPNKILCQGEEWRLFLNQKIGRALPDLPVVTNWAATDDLLNLGKVKKDQDTPFVNLLFVGWLEKEKGVFELLASLLNSRYRNQIKLTLIGDGSARSDAEAFVSRHDLKSSVHFTGWQDGDALTASFASADVFVLPSWTEGLPNAMIEAMAAGLAIVVTNVGNIPSVIKHEVNGLLVEPKVTETLVEALDAVCADRGKLKKLQRAAYDTANITFSAEKAAETISQLIDDAIQSSTKN